jgi:hypothetical protein
MTAEVDTCHEPTKSVFEIDTQFCEFILVLGSIQDLFRQALLLAQLHRIRNRRQSSGYVWRASITMFMARLT